jgi:peptidoglycan/LPS O-acetylase OafA/YrhL
MLDRDPENRPAEQEPTAAADFGCAESPILAPVRDAALLAAETVIPPQRVAPVRVERPQRRTDIQALRALAVSLVMLYDLWPNSVRGGFVGVDVFFVISGFLITAQLLEIRPSRLVELAAFWGGRIRRSLPAATLVLAATLALSASVGPPGEWKHGATGVLAAAVGVQNWALAGRSLPRIDINDGLGSVQQFWSLSVGEQFYLCWPILLLACFWVARRIRRDDRAVAGVLLTLLVLGSFAWSVSITATSPAAAFYATPSRIWELGVGALLAVVGPMLPRSSGEEPDDRLRMICAAAGLGAIACSVLAFSTATPWPGWMAAGPVLGTVVFLAARVPDESIPGLLLAAPPLQWLGGASYSIYLWHWPLIVFGPQLMGHQLSILEKLGVLVVSLLLGGLSKRFVEDRFRPARPGTKPWRTFLAALAGIVVLVGGSGAQLAAAGQAEAPAWAQLHAALAADHGCLGAGSRLAARRCPSATNQIVPNPLIATADLPVAENSNCLVAEPFVALPRCSYGPADAKVNIALVGNSLAAQWLPALRQLADRNHWRISEFLSTDCPVTTRQFLLRDPATDAACLAWGRKVMTATTAGHFAVVVTSDLSEQTSRTSAAHVAWARGFAAELTSWRAAGSKVLVLRATPLPAHTTSSPANCVAQHGYDYSACAGSRSQWVRPDPLADAATALGGPGMDMVDLTDWFCESQCPAVIGGVLVYRDGLHLTATFARTMAPALEPYLQQELRSQSSAAHK